MIISPEIVSVDEPVVQEAINKVIAQFHAEDRVFPTGQPRYIRKKEELDENGQPVPSPNKKKAQQDALYTEMLAAIDPGNRKVMERFALSRQVTATSKRPVDEQIVVTDGNDPPDYGHQSKMVRLMIFHEYLVQFV